MKTYLLPMLALSLTVSACGSEVASTAATQAELKATEIEQAQQTKERVLQKLDDANAAAQQHLQEADKANQ